jgi:cysteine desulfurase / selenocysteine lyase
MDFQAARGQFPALQEKTFLDAACVSLAPRVAADAIQKFLEMAQRCPERSATLHHIAMDDTREQARSEIARLIHAGGDEIALVESTTHGLNIVGQALPLERGDRVLISNLEFLEVAVPWFQLQKTTGIEIDLVPHRNGRVLVRDFIDRFTPRTRVVAISAVQWSNGFRVDLRALSRGCREAGVWLVVDAIQQLGAMPIDVHDMPVDFLACGGHKWLNAPFGQGFLYIHRDAWPRLRLPLAGYLSLETPPGGWGNYFQTPSISPLRDYSFVEDARTFEIGGTANYPGAVGLTACVEWLNELGPSRIAARVYELTGHLIAELGRLGIEVVTRVDPEHRSGIVTFSVGTPEKNLALMERLLGHRILVSVRYTSQVGGVRVSCHFFNSVEDLDRLLEQVENFARGRPD